MLQLLNHDRDFIPAFRLHNRKPVSKVSFIDATNLVHVVEISNN